MNTLPIVCYHGSPGSPEDFLLLEKHLPRVHLVKIVRTGYGGADIGFSGDAVVLGYSWGAVDALFSADEHIDKIKGIILVSPYIFSQQKVGLLKRVILGIPIARNLVTATAGKKAISKMLDDTSYPRPVPKEYQRAAEGLVNPHILRKALVERDLDRIRFESCLKRINSRHIPIAVIWGQEDRVGKPSEQVDSLRNYLYFDLEKKLLKAGHAIIWTHPKDVAKFVKVFIRDLTRGRRAR